jgi:hypothetical protein
MTESAAISNPSVGSGSAHARNRPITSHNSDATLRHSLSESVAIKAPQCPQAVAPSFNLLTQNGQSLMISVADS